MSQHTYHEAESYTERGWTRIAVVRVPNCPAHKDRPVCLRLGAVCYPERDFRVGSEITEEAYNAYNPITGKWEKRPA